MRSLRSPEAKQRARRKKGTTGTTGTNHLHYEARFGNHWAIASADSAGSVVVARAVIGAKSHGLELTPNH